MRRSASCALRRSTPLTQPSFRDAHSHIPIVSGGIGRRPVSLSASATWSRRGRALSVWSHLAGSLDAAPLDFSSIPIVDLQPLLDPASSSAASVSASISALRRACAEVGFFYVQRHGVPSSVLDAALSASRAFFSLPLASKLQCSCKDSPNRGYFTLGEENLGDKDEGDYKEGMDIGVERSGEAVVDAAMQRSNRWPRELPHFRPAMDAYFAAMLRLSEALTAALARSLDVPHAHFASITRAPMASLRLTHYPPQPRASVSDAHIGAGAHTDYGLLTVVAETREGLEVRNRSGRWVRCAHLHDALIVNLGDMTQRLTGGLYLSTPHRVINTVREGEEGAPEDALHRYSLPFFYEPDITARIAVLPELTAVDGVHQYEPVVFGDHLRHMYDITYKKVKPAQQQQQAALNPPTQPAAQHHANR